MTSFERSVADAWGISGRPGPLSAPLPSRRSVAASAGRRTWPASSSAHPAAWPVDLAALVRLLDDGCRSELEIWGCLEVLRAPGMPPFVQQKRVIVRGETFVLDAAYEDTMLAVEMDGAAWHGSRRQREADIRRDSLVATIGWQTLRYGFRRLTTEPRACQRDILAVHEARRGIARRDSVH